jgi:hypothetical protein
MLITRWRSDIDWRALFLWQVTDNACGAVSRMIIGGGATLPLDKVMPVLVAALPLKKDYVENETVFRMLFKLFKDQNPVVCQR